MSEHSIKTTALANSTLSISAMKKIIYEWFDGGPFDIFSFPNLISGNNKRILFRQKAKHSLQNYILYEIDELVDMHKTNKIIVFVPTLEKCPKKIEYGLMNRYPELDISVVKYSTKENKIEAYFEDKNGIFDNKIVPELSFLCSDGRLIQIICEYYEKILKEEFCYHHICIPGTTTWMTMSPQRKKMLKVLQDHINYYLIHKLINVHHGPDCGRFLQYHCIEGKINPKKAFDQHLANIILSHQKLGKLKQRLRRQNPDNYFNTLAQYCEFDEKNNILRIYVPVFQKNISGTTFLRKEHKFDFSTYEFINESIAPTEEKIRVLA